MSAVSLPVSSDAEQIERGGMTFYYNSFQQKVVPTSYQETDEDKAAIASGELNLAWGADKVEIYDFQSLVWEQNGVQYTLSGFDLVLNQDDLASMACELIEL